MTKSAQERLPPYVAYSTWKRLLKDLGQNVPSRLDSSYFDALKVSGTNRSMLKGTLIFLGLSTPDGQPTDKLQQLVKSDGDARATVLRGIVKQSYGNMLSRFPDLERATPGQMKEYFQSQGTAKDISRKCLSFFISISEECGIRTSPLLKKSNPRKANKKPPIRMPPISNAMGPLPPTTEGVHILHQLLINKFPEFDNNWPQNTKDRWFEDFQHLVNRLCGPNQPFPPIT